MSRALALTALPTGSIDAYIGAAFQLPMLSAEEEHSLAVRLRDEKDLDAAQKLITSHIRFVVRIARNYSGYGLALGDLIRACDDPGELGRLAETRDAKLLRFQLLMEQRRLRGTLGT